MTPAELDRALDAAASRLGPFTHIEFLPETGSTNDIALQRAHEGAPHGTVVLADMQTAGRGRRGRAWHSPPEAGVYLSAVLRAEAWADALSLLTLAAGVAIAEGISAATGLAVDLKWPNDLVVGRRKLAGILAEGTAHDAIVLGYGINIATTAFPPEISDRATSIQSELGRAIDRHQVFAETLAALAERYQDLLDGRFDAILGAWRRRAPRALGARVRWATQSGEQSGITEGIDDRGALLVRVGDRVERIVSGELVWEI